MAMAVDQFHELATRLKDNGVEFIIEPHLRFEGMPGEQVCNVVARVEGHKSVSKPPTPAYVHSARDAPIGVARGLP